MNSIQKISKEKMEEALKVSERQYLIGDLKVPQILEHIYDNEVEVGISHYKKFTSDRPHKHSDVTEYQMILHGKSYIKNLLTNEIIHLNEGDFYVVRKNTPYAQKSAENTKILFFKHPGMNDKINVDIDEITHKWLAEEI
jgi:mannose-6-phosphate isomerase-like protein (cupin superfamily)